MQLRSVRAWLLPALLAILSVVVVGASLSLRFLDLDTYKAQIVAQVRTALKRDLRYSSGDFSFRFGPCFTFNDVIIKEKNGVDDFIKADRLTIRIALFPLLHRHMVLARMQLEHPSLEVSRDRDGILNMADLFTTPPGGGPTPVIGGVQLTKARVRFTDLAVAPTPVVTELTDTDLYLSRLTRGKECDFKLDGSLVLGGRKVPLFLAGLASLPAPGASWTNCEINGRIKTGAVDFGHFYPYYSRLLPFHGLAGAIAVQGNFKGRPNAFKTKGEIAITGLYLDYPQVFHARLTPKLVKGSCEAELTGKSLSFNAVKLNVDGLNVQGSCRLGDLHSGDMRITAKATTSKFNLRDYRQYIPYGIIVKDTADFIEQKVLGGVYRLEDGRLDGRASQILHMEKGHNYDVLYVKAHVDEGVVAYGGSFPVCSDIKGDLYLAGKDFILKGMTGKFGNSPMALEGRIADYPLDTPARYLFTANVRVKQQEATWILGKGRIVLGDGTVAKVTGEGTTKLYNLTGEADLGGVAYTLPDLIGKPQGRPNTVAVRASFGKDDYRITSLVYTLAPLALSASSVSKYEGPVSLDLKTNQFPVADIAPLAPALAKYHPAGRVQAQLHASGQDMGHLKWTGPVALAGVSFKAGDKMRPLSAVNGTVQLTGDGAETSQLSARLGNSTISGHGSVSGLQQPAITASFSSPAIDLADLGMTRGPFHVDGVQGVISYSKEKDYLQISSLSGTIGKSQLQVKGVIQEMEHPKIDLAVTSPHLELEDVSPLVGGSATGGSRPSGKINLFVADGKAYDFTYQRLRAVAMFEENILYLQPMEFASCDGDVTAKARIDLGSGAPRYQINCSMERVSAEKMARSLGVKRQEITGTMSLQADLTAKGNNAAEIKRSALGAVRLKVERGTVKKFSTLSKVFSILNVSQLFKLKLPDMVTGGMPFNKITGNFAVRDGVASTDNLFLDSNAINVSAVGKLDLVKNELDLKIGVQPLQTVDKVVSRIPIVGWILTGKDRTLITTYFEAKGKIEDPQVKAIPVKSLAKGVLNVFKRVFELPGRLFTDTGEVIIGN